MVYPRRCRPPRTPTATPPPSCPPPGGARPLTIAPAPLAADGTWKHDHNGLLKDAYSGLLMHSSDAYVALKAVQDARREELNHLRHTVAAKRKRAAPPSAAAPTAAQPDGKAVVLQR